MKKGRTDTGVGSFERERIYRISIGEDGGIGSGGDYFEYSVSILGHTIYTRL